MVEKIAQFKEFLKREQELNEILSESEYGDLNSDSYLSILDILLLIQIIIN